MDETATDFFHFNDGVVMDDGIAASSVMMDTDNQFLVSKENPDLSEEKRRRIVYSLLNMNAGNGIPYGAQSKLAAEFNVSKATINRLYKLAREFSVNRGTTDVSSKRRGKCGRKRVYDNSDEWLESCPLNLRGTTRAYAGYLGCSHQHIWKLIKKGVLRVHTSASHPAVSDKNKLARMKWVLSHIIPGTDTQKARFQDMKHTVHVDEKWFYFNPGTRSFIMLPKETDPYRSTKHKNFSIKVMFMCATSRPIYSEDGQLIHDGKFGIWPFIYREQAKKSSKNRLAGTWETKVSIHITQEVSRDMIMNKVIPAIKEKWPACLSKDIIIQQDNAPPHINNNDPVFREASTQDGFNITLINQPSQSPNFNVLDLGLFRAIQSLQYQTFPEDIDDLVVKVGEAYDKFDPNRIRHAWITLQYVMIEALKCKGGNEFKIPHIGKAKLDRRGELANHVEVDQDILDEAVEYVYAQEQIMQSLARRTQQGRRSRVVAEHHDARPQHEHSEVDTQVAAT